MQWKLLTISIFAAFSLAIGMDSPGMDHYADQPTIDRHEINKIKLAIQQCMQRLGALSQDYREKHPEEKAEKLPLWARFSFRIAGIFHGGVRSAYELLNAYQKQRRDISPHIFEQFAKFYAKHLVERAHDFIDDMVDQDVENGTMTNVEATIVRDIFKEIMAKLDAVVLWNALQPPSFVDTLSAAAVVDTRLLRSLTRKIDASGDAWAKGRMHALWRRGTKAAHAVAHLLFLQAGLLHNAEAQKRVEQKAAGAAEAGEILSASAKKDIEQYQYNVYFQNESVKAAKTLFMDEDPGKQIKFIKMLRENIHGKKSKWPFGKKKKQLAIEKPLNEENLENSENSDGNRAWTWVKHKLFFKNEESDQKEEQNLQIEPKNNSALTIVNENSSAKTLAIYDNNKSSSGDLALLSIELFKLVDHWRVLIREFETGPVGTELVPVDPALLIRNPEIGLESVPDQLIQDYQNVKMAINELDTTEDERAQLHKVIDTILNTLKMKVSRRRIDRLESLQLLLIVHEDKCGAIVQNAKTSQGQENFEQIAEFLSNYCHEASQFLIDAIKDASNNSKN